MRKLLLIALLLLPLSAGAQEADTISRRDGFIRIWDSIRRPVYETREEDYIDVPPESSGYETILYAKRRGILDDEARFYPEEPLRLDTALLWIYRSRNIADPDEMTMETLPQMMERYPLVVADTDLSASVTPAELDRLMAQFDSMRGSEVLEMSYYGEKFAGAGTAFGETFDPALFTAAHPTFPHNTLLRVTNSENGNSVLVRVNDRGPFVPDRFLDVSEAAFLVLARPGQGVFYGTIERLGDIELVDAELREQFYAQHPASAPLPEEPSESAAVTDQRGEPVVCDDFGRRYQKRITRDVRFVRGVPHTLRYGEQLTLRSTDFFVLRQITLPDGDVVRRQQWIDPDEIYQLTPLQQGTYTFVFGTANSREREFSLRVVNCN